MAGKGRKSIQSIVKSCAALDGRDGRLTTLTLDERCWEGYNKDNKRIKTG